MLALISEFIRCPGSPIVRVGGADEPELERVHSHSLLHLQPALQGVAYKVTWRALWVQRVDPTVNRKLLIHFTQWIIGFYTQLALRVALILNNLHQWLHRRSQGGLNQADIVGHMKH